VSANSALRVALPKLADELGLMAHVPELRHTGDNAAMVAALAHARWQAGEQDPLDLPALPQSSLAASAARGPAFVRASRAARAEPQP
jgi:N6-L-threonylcarbamoyladenine synthase